MQAVLIDVTTVEITLPDPDPDKTFAGYLDTVLTIFDKYDHPFILVSTLAMMWSGSNNAAQREIDVLLRSSQQEAIVEEIVESGEWERSEIPTDYMGMINETKNSDIWLKARIELPALGSNPQYLRFWTEERYKLSVECQKLEIPDIWTWAAVTFEEEYYRDPHGRFGPPVASKHRGKMLAGPKERARLRREDVCIYVPKIADHLNALLDQVREEMNYNGNAPSWQIKNFVRYHFFDHPPTRVWLLETKIQERNRELMNKILDKWRRKDIARYHRAKKQYVFGKLPWELPVAEDENDSYLLLKEQFDELE